jgi:hypothetical protein
LEPACEKDLAILVLSPTRNVYSRINDLQYQSSGDNDVKTSIGYFILTLVLLTISLSACTTAVMPANTPVPSATIPPQPPTALEIQALVCNGCDPTISKGMIVGIYQCTVTTNEKSSGITDVYAVTYDPDSTGAAFMNVGVKKINGTWETTDKNRFNCCMDERNSKINGINSSLGNNCSQ